MTQTDSLVATLIAKPGALDDAAIARARAELPRAAPVQWLAPGEAADISFSPEPDANQSAPGHDLAERLRAALGGAADAVVQPAAHRRKRLFLADMDSTMIGQECIDELADFVGLKDHVAAITERAMRGEIAFEPALRERVALLKDLPASTVETVIAERISLNPGGRTLVATMRAAGARCCLVSGGFTLFTDRIAAMIGFDESRGNRLALNGDRLAGTVAEPIFGRDAKRDTLVALRGQYGIGHAETMAIGDGANDMAMIAEAGLGVAFHAKPRVAEAAPARVDHGDLTAMLFIQGYRKDAFAKA